MVSRADFNLGALGTVVCTVLSGGRQTYRTPSQHVVADINVLWEILDLTLEEWLSAVRPVQAEIDMLPEEARPVAAALRSQNLETRFLKALFSYIMFFTTLERAYELVLTDLSRLNKEPCFRVKGAARPNRGPYLEKVKRIRDWSIAHLQSDRTTAVNSLAGKMWQPLALSWKAGETPDLERLIFRPGHVGLLDKERRVVETSCDLQVNGLKELDSECREYLRRFDRCCCEVLSQIQARLPMTTATMTYRVLPTHADLH